MNNLVLSIFPGIDLLGRAFEEEGYCVVRGPDVLWGGDIRDFHPPSGVFGGVIGGPPCQDFSRGNTYRRDGLTYGKEMLAEAVRVLKQAKPVWWLIENVPGVPLLNVPDYHVNSFKLNNRWLGEKQDRLRVFQFGSANGINPIPFLEISLFEHIEKETCVVASEMAKGYRPQGFRGPYVPHRPWPKLLELMGLPSSFDLPPFKKAEKGAAIGEGVPLFMGRAIARAIKKAMKQ